MLSSSIHTIFQSSQELDSPVHVTGATPAGRAFFIVRYSSFLTQEKKKKKSIVVLCSNDDAASELCADIESLSSILLSEPIRVLHFPTWDQSPYSPITLSIRTRLARLNALSMILTNPPDVIVTSIMGFSQATLSKSKFQEASLTLRVEESVSSRESLISRLLLSGYLRVDPVEDAGTFAVRGDIIDVFPVDRARPVRIELFDDIIEKIREFEPTTQRTYSDETQIFQHLLIPPAREVLIQPKNSASLRENLKQRADDLGIPRSSRDPILESVKNGNYPDHSDSWAPFAYSQASTLLDYLPESWDLIWNDELSCQQEWDRFSAEQKLLSDQTSQNLLITPEVSELFRWNSQIETALAQNCKFYLDQMEIADLDTIESTETSSKDSSPGNEHPPSTRHRVYIRGNSDLSKGTRHSLGELESQLKLWIKQGFKVIALASTQSQIERIRFLLEERGFTCHLEGSPLPSTISLRIGTLTEGFRWPAEGIVLITEGEILGAQHLRKQRENKRKEKSSAAQDWSELQTLSDLGTGDAIVHLDHGIGRYQGIVRLDLSGAPSDFLLLEYANKDKLYLPVYRLNVIQKYIGAGESISLDRLGSQQFAKAKEKVKDSVKKLAFDLVQLYAKRKIQNGIQFSHRDAEFQEFEAKFPFDETPDQLKAIDAVLDDLESGKVMDRLVCGDVGYGKTEVAIRAAFRAVSDGKQVAVLVPTTVLAQQHEQSFKSRLKDYPIIIESVSRFKSTKDQKKILESVAKGKIDIVVGTHRLLSKDVNFHDLGLVIVDEEHRFGVEHKERLKTLKINTHVLTLTATPIPRTLHMALSGLRDISLINTPPVDRLPIRTYVSKYDDAIVQRAIEFELARGGQVFYLHNRVQSIFEKARRIRELVPTANVIVAHGQMAEKELEDAMLSFYQKKANILICTTIIESGVDIPSANTLLIDRADSFGLSQLYQIRGRVGRGQVRAYAYLFIPVEGGMTDDAKRRLEVIQKFVELGSGFNIASHDLEIRGGGDLLGPQQSGSIAAVGFDLYTELLEEAIRELQGQPLEPESVYREPEIKAPFSSYLSEEYVPDVHQRLSLYRRFSGATDDSEIDRLEEELRDRFGNLPTEAQNLMWVIRLKLILKRIGIESLTVGSKKVTLLPGPQSKLDPVRAIALISAYPDRYQLRPDSKIVVNMATDSLRDLYFGLESLLKNFTNVANN